MSKKIPLLSVGRSRVDQESAALARGQITVLDSLNEVRQSTQQAADKLHEKRVERDLHRQVAWPSCTGGSNSGAGGGGGGGSVAVPAVAAAAARLPSRRVKHWPY